eukprot:TRINITY_DN25449_c0_g1_i3.p1 TRINITY_DN25449_c0_g1~~TRINITY_DN25449_c0_g1_i3.p1  ORF type:complete len:725 (+),score=130.78 TRINITY_DN25449_c0_g1_i3:86-2260(+)
MSRISGEMEDTSEFKVAGVLYKWVNIAKLWRPRWFVLRDGVLSYYKIHGHDKVRPTYDSYKRFRIIGVEAKKLLRKHRSSHFLDGRRRPRVYGEIYIKISSIKPSRSDEKKFYIFTGIKTLHLRAETREDRELWINALHLAKDSFFKGRTTVSMLPQSQEYICSTEVLRNRLQQEHVSEEAIKDCESIMLSEFSNLQEQLRLLQQHNITLLEVVRQLKAEKMELEAKVVDETEGHMQTRNPTNFHDDYQGGSDSDIDDEKGSQVEAEADSDSDDVFFDTAEHLVSDTLIGQCSFRLSGKPHGNGSPRCGAEFHVAGDLSSLNIETTDYPYVARRKKLPDPKETERSVSLWSLIKDNIGKDLTKVCLPVYFNEPISSLQKCFEDFEYSELLDRAYIYGKKGDSLMRILNVAAFAVSGYSSTKGRTCKPFNPLLGETYEADYPDKRLRFISEKVSHHPMTVACHCTGSGWVFWGDSTLKSKFWGRSIQLDPVGVLTLEFSDGETFRWSKVTTSIYNLILGKIYCDHYGVMHIKGNQSLSCKLKFKEQSIMERNPHQVQGYVYDANGKKLATLIGKWDESMHFVMGDIAEKPRSYDPMSEAVLLWKKNDPPEYPTRYNLTSFAITLNELTPGLKEKLPPTDSRLRPDQRLLENGEYSKANSEKLHLEQKQRMAYTLQQKGWQPRWFTRENNRSTFVYAGGYWEARENSNWEGCPDLFGQETAHMTEG